MHAPKWFQDGLHALDYFRVKAGSFRQTFGSMTGQEVMRHLMDYCNFSETTFDPDPRIHAVLEGRRQVLLYIIDNCRFSPEELLELNAGRSITTMESPNA